MILGFNQFIKESETKLPPEINHREALRKERSTNRVKLSQHQINTIKELIPKNYQLDINQGGGWADPKKELVLTSVTIHKNNYYQVNIRALEDEYFMIQKVRDSKMEDWWWLCDGFEQVVAWLKDYY